ncbi:MAG: PaaI family thioesterase [Rhodothalassiaceae bacterium]
MDKALIERVLSDPDFAGALTGIPYAEFLGLRVVRRDGHLHAHLPFDDKVVGAPQRLHGGVTGAVLELAAMMQVLKEAAEAGRLPERLPKPIGMTVEYLRAGLAADLWASAEVTRQGRRVVNVRATAWQQEPGQPIAAGLMHFLMPEPGHLPQNGADGASSTHPG